MSTYDMNNKVFNSLSDSCFTIDRVPGTYLDYVLYIPENISPDASLIVVGMTPNSRYSYSQAYLQCINRVLKKEYEPIPRILSETYNCPMIFPIIPKIRGNESYPYASFLGYDTYHLTDETSEVYKVDEQVVKMIDYATDYINTYFNTNIDNKVIMTGFSASCKFANHFTALHPDKVKMVIGGATGGLCIYPLKEIKNPNSSAHEMVKLNFPLGFNDIDEKDKTTKMDLFKKIPQFYYMGNEDVNDPSRPQFVPDKEINEKGEIVDKTDESGNVIPAKDEHGHYIYARDEQGEYIIGEQYYSLEQIHFLHDGKLDDQQYRFNFNRDIYIEKGVPSVFKKYDGKHNLTEKAKEELHNDVINFYNEYIYNLDNKEERKR